MMKKSYKEAYPNPCGMYSAEELRNIPHGSFKEFEKQKIQEEFITAKEASQIMGCSRSTALKKLEAVDAVCFDDGATARLFFKRSDAMKVIRSYQQSKLKPRKMTKS